MATQQDPAREELAAYYRSSIEQGKQPSLKWLADNSQDLVGQSVSYDTVKWWAKEDQWTSILADSLDGVPTVRDTKVLFDKAKAILFDKSRPWKEIAGAARLVVSLAKTIPDAYQLLVEVDIADCYEEINRMLLDHFDEIDSTHRTTLGTVRGQLYKMMPQDVQVVQDGVSPDAALLESRER